MSVLALHTRQTEQTPRRLIAIAGNPNAGKTTLFNALTGTRQKVANYPGVTVERKVGHLRLPSGEAVDVVDLPGCYSLAARSPEEQIAHDVLIGRSEFALRDEQGNYRGTLEVTQDITAMRQLLRG